MERFVVAALFFLSVLPVFAQEDTQSVTADAQQYLQRAARAFAGDQPVSSVTLTGPATWVAGTTNENGQATLIARADGSSSLHIALASADRSEMQDTFVNGHGCSWTDRNGTVHATSAHNCVIPFAWFLPGAALFSTARPTDGVASISSARDGQANFHWHKAASADAAPEVAKLLGHINSYDLRFSPTTSLPTELIYTLHPDKGIAIDIPVKVQYADYRVIDGVSIPFHIQRYVNGVLSLDIVIMNAVVAH